MIDRFLLWLFIKLGCLWFKHILITTDKKTGRASTVAFSTKYYTVEKMYAWMKEKDIV
jgi:hypothetical protein